MMRQRLPDIAIIVGLFIVPLLFFAPVTLGGRTLVPADNLYQDEPYATERVQAGVPEIPHNALLSDLVLQNFQWKSFIRGNLREGEIPLWQPNQFAGTTFLANGQHSMLYPFSVIYYVLPLDAAYGWFAVSQLWLAGLLMYLYIRGIGLSRIAGLIAALTIQLSSFFIVATVHPMIQAGAAWLPLELLMIEYVLLRKPFPGTRGKPSVLPWVLIGAVGLGMCHLAGHIEIVYYTLLVMAFYTACRLIWMWWPSKAHWRKLMTPALALIGMVVLGFGFGAVQFIPGVEAANNSFRTDRQDSLDDVLGYALPNRHIAKFFMPNVYGNPAHHSYFDVFEWKTISQDWQRTDPANPETPIRVTNTDFGIKNYVEGGVYLGILPLLLAILGVYAGIKKQNLTPRPPLQTGEGEDRQPPYRGIFGLLALTSLSFMFGLPTYAFLYYGLPGVDQLHTPFRWIWPFTVCIAVLAAFGAEALQKSRGEAEYGEKYYQTEAARQPLYVLAKRAGWGLIGVGIAILAGLIGSRIFYNQADGLVERIFDGLAKANEAFPNVKAFYSYEFRNVLIFGLMVVGAGVVFRISRCPIYAGRGTRKIPIWQTLAVLLILVDLFAATFDFNTAAKKEWLGYKPEPIAWLQQKMTEEGPFRIQAYTWKRNVLNANVGWRYGLQDVRGYDSLFSKEYADLMGQVTPQEGLAYNRIDPVLAWKYPDAIASPILDLLNVRYIITDWLIQEPERLGFEEAYVNAGVRIYRNLNALPRAYTVPVDSETPHPAYLPALDHMDAPLGTATITSYQDITVMVDATVEQDAWLVLADSYDAGWRAFVRPLGGTEDDEKEIDVQRVNGNLRAVKLDAGAWTVRFRYSPASFQIGAFTSFVSGMLVIFLALLWLWTTFVGEQSEGDTGRRVLKNSVAPIALNLFNRLIDFAFAFIMLRMLGPDNAGIYYYAIVMFGWFDIFTNFGLNTLLTRDISRDKDAAGRYLYNTTLLRIGLAGLAVPVLIAVLFIRDATVSPSLDHTAVISIFLLYIGLVPNSISTGLTALFYAFEKAEYPAAISTVTTLFKVTLGLGALLLGWGVVGLAGASIITNLATLLILMRLAWPLIKGHWKPIREKALQRMMIRESWPLMINHLLATVFFKSDVILMEAINGAAIVGLYSTAYKWLDALNIIPAFFTMALLPLMSRQKSEGNIDGLVRNYTLAIKILVAIAVPTAVFTTFLGHALVAFLGGSEFLPEGAIALQIMIWSILIGWMNSLTQYVLIAVDRQRQITRTFIVAVSFNIIANLIFLPHYSYRAAAVTTILSEGVLFIGFVLLLRPVLGRINWLTQLWRLWMAGAVTFGVTWLLWQRFPLLALVIGVGVYSAAMMVLKPFNTEEQARIKSLMPQRMRRIMPRWGMVRS
ncbi:MAG: oligosaccharide flippase family protein [Chloroflexi bacterium]|nr:oligosaccharide flippase family protein [Chloroflexota bacterium]